MNSTTGQHGAPEVATKVCAKCRKERPIGVFRLHRHTADGLESRCDNCRPRGANRGLAPDERFDAKHEPRDAGHITPCWVWTGALNRHGYGSFRPGGTATCVGAHIWSFRRAGGVIPPGHELDHLCRNRACVNPSHLEPVTSRINSLRGATFAAENASKTHCANGHPFEGDNLIPVRDGNSRACRECRSAAKRKHNQKTKRERAARTPCPNGHSLVPGNLVGNRPGGGCLTCRRNAWHKSNRAKNPNIQA